MREALAFCPGSLSFIFKMCPNKDLTKMGSVGVGATLNKGVIASVKPQSTASVYFNQTPIRFPTVTSVVTSLTIEPVKVQIESELPLGYGFGISGASALACAFALNKLFNLGKSDLELARIAHIAEIVNHTGLGSVATQLTGGFLWKTAPGLPVKAKFLPFTGQKIYALILGKLETPSILMDRKRLQKINKAADAALKDMQKDNFLTLDRLFDSAYIFAKESSLLNNEEIVHIIETIKTSGGHATMGMLGQVVISDRKPEFKLNYPVVELTIVDDKVHLI